MQNILITGGAGFIGSHLADELLAHGYRVRVLDSLEPQVHGEGRRNAHVRRQVHRRVLRLLHRSGRRRVQRQVRRQLQGRLVVRPRRCGVRLGRSLGRRRDHRGADRVRPLRVVSVGVGEKDAHDPAQPQNEEGVDRGLDRVRDHALDFFPRYLRLPDTADDDGNAVVDLHSFFKEKTFKDPVSFECYTGNMMTGVTLKGTYVRTLAEDIGDALGTGAHLAALRRTGSGGFRVEGASALEALEAMPESVRARHLLPLDSLLAGITRAELDPQQEARFRQGQALKPFSGEGLRAVYGADGRLVGLGQAELGPDVRRDQPQRHQRHDPGPAVLREPHGEPRGLTADRERDRGVDEVAREHDVVPGGVIVGVVGQGPDQRPVPAARNEARAEA